MLGDHWWSMDSKQADVDVSGTDISRRTLLRAGGALGGGLLLAIALPVPAFQAANAREGDFSPGAFVRIDRSGAVTLTVPQVEMGQGIYTAQAMLVAEELDVDLAQVTVEHAPADDRLYGNPLLGFQVTGASTSVRAFYIPLREAGAAARMMLTAAAAELWGIAASTCATESGSVVHPPTRRRLGYGELVDRAAEMPVPRKVALRTPSQFRLIGTPAKRLDGPAKVNGEAVFGIDVKLPGMKIATVAACPVFGGKLAAVDDAEALAVKGSGRWCVWTTRWRWSPTTWARPGRAWRH